MNKKIIGKMIVSALVVLLGAVQLVVFVSCFFSFTGGGALAGLASTIPQFVSLPMLVTGIIDVVCLCKYGKSDTIKYKSNYNVLLGVLISVFTAIFGIVCLINGALGFFVGAMAEGYGDTVYLVGIGAVYALYVPVICVILFVAEIVTTILVAKDKA